MPKHYRAPNKRIIHRSGNGRFRQSTLQDIGIPAANVATGKMKCAGCGHEWYPLVKTGICPECDDQRKAPIVPNAEQQARIDRYNAIKKDNPFGIDPRDHDLQDEAARLFAGLRRDGLI